MWGEGEGVKEKEREGWGWVGVEMVSYEDEIRVRRVSCIGLIPV